MFNKEIVQKKSAIDLTEIAIGLIIVGLVVAIGTSILLTLRNSRIDTLDSYRFAANESSGTVVNETGVTLDGSWVSSIVTITNASTNIVMGNSNYTLTVNQDFGTSVLKYSGVAGAQNNSMLNITYDVRNTTGAAWSVPNNASIGLGEYGNWFKIIAIMGAAALVLALIYMMMNNRTEGGNSQSSTSPY